MTNDERWFLAGGLLVSILWWAVLFNTGASTAPKARIETPDVLCIHALSENQTMRVYRCYSIYGDTFWYKSKIGDAA